MPACWRPVPIVTCRRFALSCAHTQALNTLRETQLDQDRRISGLDQKVTGLDQKMTEGFAMLSTGMAQITALLTGKTGSGPE